MATESNASNKEVVQVLDKIKTEILQRKQLRAQQDTNKQLSKVNNSITKLGQATEKKEPQKEQLKVKFPSVLDFVNGFSKVSPIFTRDYNHWMKSSLDAANDSSQTLERISSKVDNLQGALAQPKQDTSEEYLDLISDQLKSIHDLSIKRMGQDTQYANDEKGSLVRIADSTEAFQKDGVSAIVKSNHSLLVRVNDVNQSVRKVGGKIVGTLIRMMNEDGKWREKQDMHNSEIAKEGKNLPVASSVVPKDDDEKSDSSGLAGMLAAMLGLKGLKMPFKSLGFIGKLFSKIGKFGEGALLALGPLGKALKFLKVGPLALISSIIDFGKGFINAKEILGKGKVNIVDRVRAGITELVGGFGDLFDWVAKIFGFDTDAGKKVRDFALKITEKPAEWLNSIVNWVSNDLFAGITRSTSLTAIPGKLADNLQTELTKLVDWISAGISSFVDDGIKAAGKVVDDLKKGFDEKVKKPFFDMLNSITNSMFDLLDQFVSLIPDALGGDTARKKIDDMRKTMTIDTGNAQQPQQGQGQGQDGQQTQPQGQQPKQQQDMRIPAPNEIPTLDTPKPQPTLPNEIPTLDPPVITGQTLPTAGNQASSPILVKNVPDDTTKDDNVDKLKDAYAKLGAGILGQATSSGSRSDSNISQIQSVYSKAAPTVIAPISQNVDNSKRVNNNTTLNSSSLETSNQQDTTRLLWDY